MRFSIEALMTYRFEQSGEVLLLLEAAHTPDQRVFNETLRVSPPTDLARRDDETTGERGVLFTAAPGDVEIAYRAEVERLDRDDAIVGVPAAPLHELPLEALRYMRPSHFCPSDRFVDFACQQFGHLEGGDKVAAILDWIAGHLTYEAGASNEWTTAQDTFHSGTGVCRDFAHLAITLCRAADIPARAVSAYAWRLQPPDLHMVAEVYLEGTWRLVDASGLAPIDGLVRVATGLDAADIAFMTIFGRAEVVSQSFAIEQARATAAA
jgi:transglutaminase-like putative cysteine protease